MKNISRKRRTVTTPMELVNIFYDEALRISSNRDDAAKLANEAVTDFLSHYRLVKSRVNGHARM